eukprot:CAMPEP_0169155298 /NCGR_PEP_ID=MMETSP1015-20121227/53261_1 /TAXON_ID=342587 /ORGANISM="Karlodinium micrum, Strain CCMP2283" /LENGTH=101 /DNA_ID=CAMNT_0009225727 /DNA_START=494 /DNA_END=799 /DNA_ORIENTATION=-
MRRWLRKSGVLGMPILLAQDFVGERIRPVGNVAVPDPLGLPLSTPCPLMNSAAVIPAGGIAALPTRRRNASAFIQPPPTRTCSPACVTREWTARPPGCPKR